MKTHQKRTECTKESTLAESGYIYRKDADEALDVTISVCAWGQIRTGAHARGNGRAWGRTQQLGSSREFPSVGATGGALCHGRPLRRTGTAAGGC